MSLRKDFSSLRKSRPSGVVPQNLLNKSVHKISIPTANTINSGASYITDPLDVDEKIRSADIKTCFFDSISIRESGLADDPIFSIGIQDINFNGTNIHSRGADLTLSLSANAEYLYVTKLKVYINKLVLPRLSIKYAYFSDDKRTVLFILQRNIGYFLAKLSEKDTHLCSYLTTNMNFWIGAAPVTVELAKIEEKLREEVEKRENAHMSTGKVITYKPEPERIKNSRDPPNLSSDLTPESLSSLQSKLPKIPSSSPRQYTRQTRSFSKANPVTYEDAEDEDEDEVEEFEDTDAEPMVRESPAKFDPPLKYTLRNDKKFIISFNDFKTLYNNDWINDTLIDFFIAYDMDHAVHDLKSVEEEKVYAFNSFFFTKVFSKLEGQDSPPYYQNVRRWLSKIDLMSYDSVIIPINEHLHWYCAVIKNLPQLLAYAQTSEVSPDNLGEVKKKKPFVDVYVIDSLRQPHTNISAPLKTVIKEYCREKHGVEIPTELIRFSAVRVPRQRNFNDCGIHVIYNIQKWLAEPDACEIMWRRHNKMLVRAYFKSSERSDMRQKLIGILLDLHSKQDEQKSDKLTEDVQSEDDIEEISYLSSKPTNEDKDSKREKDCPEKKDGQEAMKAVEQPELITDSPVKELPIQKQVSSPDDSARSMEDKKSIPSEINDTPDAIVEEPSKNAPRTLDPRKLDQNKVLGQIQEKAASSFGLMVVEHPQIRKLCTKLHPKAHTVIFLNGMFSNHNKQFDEQKQKLIKGLIKKYNDSETHYDLRSTETLFKELLQEPAAPMDEPFVIQESDDSGGELNRSVGDLRISEDETGSLKKSSRLGNTPEATRIFMKQAEEPSPSKLSKLRSRGTSHASSSDIEVLEDDVEFLSEVSGSDIRTQNTTAGDHRRREEEVAVFVTDEEDSHTSRGRRELTFLKSPKRRRLGQPPSRRLRPH